MSLDVAKDTEKLKNNLNIYGIFTLIGLLMLLLFVTSGNRIYTNISEKVKVNKELESDISLLNTKVNALKKISNLDYSDISVLSASFPEEDSSLFMYTSLKELSIKDNVFISKISFNPSTKTSGDISESSISFTASGSRDNILSFLVDITRSAPLSGLGTIYFEQYPADGGEFGLNMSVDVYYSPYPETLPDIAGVVSPLNDEEKKVYDILTHLKILMKSDLKPMNQNNQVEDPFSAYQTTESNIGEQVVVETPEAQ